MARGGLEAVQKLKDDANFLDRVRRDAKASIDVALNEFALQDEKLRHALNECLDQAMKEAVDEKVDGVQQLVDVFMQKFIHYMELALDVAEKEGTINVVDNASLFAKIVSTMQSMHELWKREYNF